MRYFLNKDKLIKIIRHFFQTLIRQTNLNNQRDVTTRAGHCVFS